MTDRRVVFAVTIFLGLIVLGGLASIVALTMAGKPVPEMIALTTTTALGSLGTLLASTHVDPGQLPAARPSVEDAPTTPTEKWIRTRLATDDHGPKGFK